MHETESDLVFTIIIACAGIGILVFFFVIVIINHFRVNARKQAEIFNAIFETQIRERKRIAEDMHDDLGASLSGIKMRLNDAHSEENPVVKTVLLNEAEKELDASIQQVRLITHNLMPRNIEEHGLIMALDDLKRRFEMQKKLRVNFSHAGLSGRLTLMFELNLYRIISELMNNAIKHADADTITFSLEKSDSGLQLIFSDNGKGFTENDSSDGIGLKNIESRVNLFKGKYSVETGKNSGTTFTISFEQSHLFSNPS